ncbi:MAG: hypothetical protein QXK88_00210 [Desulfurococcaceae archaeon]
MGGLKKSKVSTPTGSGEKGKEIKIVTRSIISASDVEKNPRLLKLLYVISLLENGISEKALVHLVRGIEEVGVKFGYTFIKLGDMLTSRELINDLTALKYTGMVEVSRGKKLVVTGVGKELLDKSSGLIQGEISTLKKAFDETWPRVAPIDLEVNLKATRRS